MVGWICSGGMDMYGNDKDDAMHQLKLYILNHKEVLSLDANLDAEAVVSEISSFVDCVVNVTGVAKENTQERCGGTRLVERSFSFFSKLLHDCSLFLHHLQLVSISGVCMISYIPSDEIV